MDKRTTELGRTNRRLQQEIVEHKLADERIKASLREKEVLLREVHHRVKNNLAVVSSLLSMQAGRVEGQSAHAALQESRNRVASMSLIHEILYQSEDLSAVDLEHYVGSLTANLAHAYGYTGRVDFRVKTGSICLEASQAVPCGLIINELATNSLKHAFQDGKGGSVRISADALSDDTIELRVGDDGVGFPDDLDWRKSKTLGLRLISLMVDQLHGSWEMRNDPGTEIIIRWPSGESQREETRE